MGRNNKPTTSKLHNNNNSNTKSIHHQQPQEKNKTTTTAKDLNEKPETHLDTSKNSVVINDTDSESSTQTTTSSSRHSENYEAEDENDSAMKIKEQTQQETQTQQHLMQVQKFLKSFRATGDSSPSPTQQHDEEEEEQQQRLTLEKSTNNTLAELRSFRQAKQHKPGKFNISTKFLRKSSRNKLKYHNAAAVVQLQHHHHSPTTASPRAPPAPDHRCGDEHLPDMNLNNCDESIAKLRKDFSIDSLLKNN